MKIGEQIKTLEAQRGEYLTEIEKIVQAAEAESRSLTDEEQTQYDAFETKATDLDPRIANLRKTEDLLKTRSTPAGTDPNTVVTTWGEGARVGGKVREKGAFFGAMARAMYASKGNYLMAEQYARSIMKDEELAIVCRAAVAPGDTTVTGWAAELISQATGGFWDLLRPMSIYARFPGVTATLGRNGEVLLPGVSAGTQGAWVGQNNPIPVKRPTFTRGSLKPLKLGVITVVSRELLAQSNPSVDAILRDMMLKDTAIVLDATFIDNVAASAGVRPAGLQTYDLTPLAATNTTLATIETDIKNTMGLMITANVDISNCVWIMNPARALGLSFLVNATGVYPFRDMINNGNLFGIPVLTSTTCPTGVVLLVAADSVVKLSNGSPEIAVSEDATLHMEDTSPAQISTAGTPNTVAAPVRSVFQDNEVALRLIMPAAWELARTGMVQVITGATW